VEEEEMKVRIFLVWSGVLFVLSVAFFPGGGLAADKRVYTMDEVVKEALASNWRLKAKKETIHQAQYVKNQARADFLPKLSTSYGYLRYGSRQEVFFSDFPGPIEVGAQNNYQWKGTVTQPLFTGFALISSYRLAQLGIDQSELEVQLETLDLALEAKTAYIDILTADHAVETAVMAAEALESHAEVARNFYKVGMIPINDLLQSEVEASNAKHYVIKTRNRARLARARLNTILSRPVNADIDVEEIEVLLSEKGDFQGYLEQALRDRPEIKLIDNKLLQTEQMVRLAKSKNYPEIAFVWEYTKEGDTPAVNGGEFHQASNWSAQAALTWTLWEWGKTYYTVKERESIKNELLKTKMQLEQEVQLQIKDAVLNMETAETNIPITRKAVEQGEENLRVTRERYKAQVSTSTEVLDAQRYLTDARVFYFNALFQYHLARARLKRAMGAY